MSATTQVTVRDLLLKIDAATERMSNKNAHKVLLVQCAYALIELAQRAKAVEPQEPLHWTPELLDAPEVEGTPV